MRFQVFVVTYLHFDRAHPTNYGLRVIAPDLHYELDTLAKFLHLVASANVAPTSLMEQQ